MIERLTAFVEYAGERAIKTVAQTALATIAASQVIGIIDVDWVQVLSVSALAGILSVLTSVAFPTKSLEAE
jgi:uncharacterized membrane protein (DUF373 family)